MSKTALITGASYGIGAAFAQELAKQRTDLILVARSEEKLQRLAQDLTANFKIQTLVIRQDLAQLGAAEQVCQQVNQRGWQVDLLINNAGFGDYGEFAGRSLSRQSEMVQLNVQAVVELTHIFLLPMQQRGSGAIINVSSIAAFQPMPYLSVYAATKAFILSFSEALWAENRDRGIQVLVICPGPTETNFAVASGLDQAPDVMPNQNLEDPKRVVKEAIQALQQGQSTLVTGGWQNQAIAQTARLAPRDLLAKFLAQRFKPKV
jgi:uncharacterized protein